MLREPILVANTWRSLQTTLVAEASLAEGFYSRSRHLSKANGGGGGGGDDDSVVLVRKQTTQTKRPPHVGEVSANFCG
jgi:hypothetical protein